MFNDCTPIKDNNFYESFNGRYVHTPDDALSHFYIEIVFYYRNENINTDVDTIHSNNE